MPLRSYAFHLLEAKLKLSRHLIPQQLKDQIGVCIWLQVQRFKTIEGVGCQGFLRILIM